MNQSSNFGNILSEIISKIPEQSQIELLDHQSNGKILIESPNTENLEIFTPITPNLNNSIFKLIKQIENIKSIWPNSLYRRKYSERVFHEYSNVLLRQLLILKSQLRFLYSLPVFWNSIEVWNLWKNLQNFFFMIVNYLLSALMAKLDFSVVFEYFSLFSVHLRWGFSSLCEIQRFDYIVK